ncbi:MAG: 3-dehydroquinate synthase [Bacteroidota bacterium]
MKRIRQSFAVPFTYDVHFTSHIFDSENTLFVDLIREAAHEQQMAKCFFVIDKGVEEAHPQLIGEIGTYCSMHSEILISVAEPLVVTGGEEVKNEPEWVDKIIEAVNVFGIDRHSYIIGIGGGAVLDMVGYAASVAHRGVRHIRIPTTVLSQNDSGVGVKNGVNYCGKKNFVGNFAPPFAVINDKEFLLTLDDRDWRSGISEALKVALIKDLKFFEEIEADAPALARREMAPMESLIYRCAEMHMDHIATGDPFEMGSSRPLDFGHWSAHKLEQLTDYRIRHGEAVAIGISLDVLYSSLLGWISQEEALRVLRVFETLGFDLYVPELTQYLDDPSHPQSILSGLNEFREHLGGRLTIMLLKDLGKGVEVHEMDATKVAQAVSLLLNYTQKALI